MNLTVNNLSIAFGFKLVLHKLSLHLQQGQILQIKGENGVGKSVLLNTIDKGSHPKIHNGFDGTMLIDQKDGIRTELLVKEQLAFWMGLTKASTCLQCWDLPRDAPIKYLSLGQKQRLSLARLDIIKANLWLLDEPYHGLDTNGKNILNSKILNQTQTGSVIIVSHNALQIPINQVITLSHV